MFKIKLVYLMSFVKDYKMIQQILKKDPKLNKVEESVANLYVESLNCQYICIFDPEYPNQLKLLEDPPWVIYYYGDISLLNKKLICLIGNNRLSNYGKKVVDDIVNSVNEPNVICCNFFSDFMKRVVINTGTNIKNNIFISEIGFDKLRDFDKKKVSKLACNNLIISLYAPCCEIIGDNIFRTDKIMVSLSKKIIIVETYKNSVIFNLVDLALDLDIGVYVVPTNIYDITCAGNNMLLAEGAGLLYFDWDI